MEKNLKLVLAGKEGGATKFYRAYAPMVRRFLANKVGSDVAVEELLQDTFLSAFDALPLYRGESSLKTWLIGIARHEVADYYRKRYVRKVVEQTGVLWEGVAESLTTPEGELKRKELSERFDMAMGKIAKKYRQIIDLRYQKGLSVKEIAVQLDLSFKATESLLYRARGAFVEEYGTQ